MGGETCEEEEVTSNMPEIKFCLHFKKIQEPSVDILYLPFSCFPPSFPVTGSFLNPSQAPVHVCELSGLIIQFHKKNIPKLEI